MLGLKGPWFIDDEIAAAVIERIQQFDNDIVIDFEHQTLKSAENGKPAPAAGWIKRDSIVWVAGKGLFAENVEWTDEAKDFIESKKYKYISPVFAFSKSTGNVLDVRQVALTNDPAIDGMQEAIAAATAKFLPTQPHKEEDSMNPELLKLLGLAADATDDQAVAACQALVDANTDLTQQVKDQETAIAAAKAEADDAATEAIAALQAQVAALAKSTNKSEMDKLIAAAKAEGKLIPALETWARKQTPEQLQAYLDDAPQIAALTGKQTDDENLDADAGDALTDAEVAVCKGMGISEEDFKKQKQEDN
jgi:phage I-like protein